MKNERYDVSLLKFCNFFRQLIHISRVPKMLNKNVMSLFQKNMKNIINICQKTRQNIFDYSVVIMKLRMLCSIIFIPICCKERDERDLQIRE